jgi:aminoglycoside phosphotransferase (APT) family kinase protein
MFEITAETARAYLVDGGRIAADEDLEIETLAGGVSNVVLWISPARGEPFVLKQSRPQLRTQIDWFSRPERIFREAEAQRALAGLLTPGVIPKVVFEDRPNYCFAMTAIRPDHAVWKRQLLAGSVDGAVFVRAGELLAQIHAGTFGRTDLLTDAEDATNFFELRGDPFYVWIARVHPEIGLAVERLQDAMGRHKLCLVHADFSPKNILVHPDGISLVDHETVHYGDPAFDLGFFFSHLWLKALAVESARPRIIDGIFAAWDSYRRTVRSTNSPFNAELAELSVRAVPHLAGCLLARVDGKSPVDYLDREPDRDLVRRVSITWLNNPPMDFDSALQQLASRIS